MKAIHVHKEKEWSGAFVDQDEDEEEPTEEEIAELRKRSAAAAARREEWMDKEAKRRIDDRTARNRLRVRENDRAKAAEQKKTT
jgi:hypothetical protein